MDEPTKIFNELMYRLREEYKEMNDCLRTLGNKRRYTGGVGDRRRTFHEMLFSFFFPQFEEQVVFGTGKDGFKKYGAKKFTADFYSPDDNYIVEIDGDLHKATYFDFIRDMQRDEFFKEVYGIQTFRHSNKSVEEIVMYHIAKQYEQGNADRLKKIIEQHFHGRCLKSTKQEANRISIREMNKVFFNKYLG